MSLSKINIENLNYLLFALIFALKKIALISILTKNTLILECEKAQHCCWARIFKSLAAPYSHMGNTHTTIGTTAFHF